MKKIIFFFGVICVFQIQFLYAQKLNEDQVPAIVRQNFSEKFKGVKMKWEKSDDGNFEAKFKKTHKEIFAVFNSEGKWQETRTELILTELPANIFAFIYEKYMGYNMESGEKIERANGITYHLQLENKKNKKLAELTFDQQGSIREEVMKDVK